MIIRANACKNFLFKISKLLFSLKFEFSKLTVIIADSAHFESVPPSFCRFTSSCNAFCYFVRVNFMIHAFFCKFSTKPEI